MRIAYQTEIVLILGAHLRSYSHANCPEMLHLSSVLPWLNANNSLILKSYSAGRIAPPDDYRIITNQTKSNLMMQALHEKLKWQKQCWKCFKFSDTSHTQSNSSIKNYTNKSLALKTLLKDLFSKMNVKNKKKLADTSSGCTGMHHQWCNMGPLGALDFWTASPRQVSRVCLTPVCITHRSVLFIWSHLWGFLHSFVSVSELAFLFASPVMCHSKFTLQSEYPAV